MPSHDDAPAADPETGWMSPQDARESRGWTLQIGSLRYVEDHCEVPHRGGKFIVFSCKTGLFRKRYIRLKEGDWTKPDAEGVVRLAHVSEDKAVELAQRLSGM